MPTPLGHSLWSVSMYLFFRSSFNDLREIRNDLFTIVLCLIIGIAPDIDFIFVYISDNPYLHRSVTHSITFLLVGAFIGGYILKNRNTVTHKYLLCLSLLSGHVLFDLLTKCDRIPYGTMIYWPFKQQYYKVNLSIFPGFDWLSLEGLFSIFLIKQVIIELTVFLPIIFLVLLHKKGRGVRI